MPMAAPSKFGSRSARSMVNECFTSAAAPGIRAALERRCAATGRQLWNEDY
jgi:hypothetical protein